MKRSGTIAVIAVTAGVLVAGSAAAVAVVNAGSSAPEPPTLVAVVDPDAVVAPTAGPSFVPAPLPDISLPAIAPTDDSAPKSLMTRAAAQAAVLGLASGDVLSVEPSDRGGYDAFAVAVRRADGSTVTGYVDRASGVVFDWTQKAAPATQATGERKDDSREGATSTARDDDDDSDEQSEHGDSSGGEHSDSSGGEAHDEDDD